MKYKASFTEYTDNANNTGLTLAQQIGKALGMRNGNHAGCKGGVMGSEPFADRVKWTPCSNQDFENYYSRRDCLECDPGFFTTTTVAPTTTEPITPGTVK